LAYSSKKVRRGKARTLRQTDDGRRRGEFQLLGGDGVTDGEVPKKREEKTTITCLVGKSETMNP